MNRRELARLDRDLSEFLDTMMDGMGRVERVAAMRAYVTGLLLDGERKSIEPMASRLVDSPREVEAMRQRLQQAVSVATWSDSIMFERLAKVVEAELPGIEALVLDDTGFAKKGKHSVGVARQYSGTLGRVDNCQVAVSLHLAGEGSSACIAFDLYVPKEWTEDGDRRAKAGIPEGLEFRTKHKIALAQIDRALASGVRKYVVLGDAGYGDSTAFREEVTARELTYVVAVNGEPVVWPPESDPQPRPAPHRKKRHFDADHPPETVRDLAARLTYRKVTWREGSKGWQASRFAAVRVRTAHRHVAGDPPGDEQWLLAEWPKDKPAPCRFWLSTLPKATSVRTLVRKAKLRWRVERDYEELKQEVGLDHFEGRTWRGFHHHATLCALAHAFLALRRALFPPEQDALDDFLGASSASAGPASPDRRVSDVPTRGHGGLTTDGDVGDVIESY